MLWLLRFLLIGPESFRPIRSDRSKTQVSVDIPTGSRAPFQEFTYGHMVVRVWQNWSGQGDRYYNLDLVRTLGRGRLAKYFRPEDLDDARRCIDRISAWLRDGN